MKKIPIVLSVCLLFGTLFTIGCTDKIGFAPDNFDYTKKDKSNFKDLKDSNPKSLDDYNDFEMLESWRKINGWQNKLNDFVSGNFANLIRDQSSGKLKLLKFKKLRGIGIKNALKSTSISGETLFPIYTKIGKKFMLVPFKKISLSKIDYKKMKDSVIDAHKGERLILVKLFWKYNGNIFSTNGIVSITENKIIYDEIIYNLIIIGKRNYKLTYQIFPLYERFSETPPDSACYVFSTEAHAPLSGAAYGPLGGVAYAEAAVIIRGEDMGGGISIVFSNGTSQQHDDLFFIDVDADAKAHHNSGSMAEYALGACIGTSVSVNITAYHVTFSGGVNLSESMKSEGSVSPEYLVNRCETNSN